MKKLLLFSTLVFLSSFLFGQKNQIDLPINWNDTATVNYDFFDFDGTSSSLVADPLNSNNIVLKTDKSPGGQPWQGTILGNTGLASPIPFAQGSTTISAVVYSPDSGIAVRLKVENDTLGSVSVETEAMTTVANGWDTLVFDFNNNSAGTPAINFSNAYKKIVIFYDFLNNPSATKSYYVDDIFMGGTVPPPPTYNVTFRVNMDTVNASYTTPEVNGTFNNWCGNCNAMTDANNDSIWEVTVQLPAGNYEFKYSADVWNIQENLAQGSPCTITNGPNTNRALVVSGDTVLPVVCWASCSDCGATPPPPGKVKPVLPITWDDTANVNYNIVDFDGTSSMIVADPMNASNLVLETVKDSAGQPWQGTILGDAGLGNPIPFASGATTMSAIVYSPASGVTVRMKVEDSNDPTIFAEVDVTTQNANAWDTLVFDFGAPAGGSINFANTYDKVVIFYDFLNLPALPTTYYVDDVFFGGSSTPPPAADTVEITFNVNADLITVDSTGVYIAGGGNFGNPGDNQLVDPDGDGTYSLTIKRLKGFSSYYTFTNGACPDYSCKENIAGQPCANPSNFNDRFLPAVMKDTVISTCFGFCSTDGTCPSAPDTSSVTFKVDMNEYGQSFTTPEINGTFNNWCGSCDAMEDPDGDNIWEVTLRLADGTYEYKFSYDNWSGQETFDPATGDSLCTLTTGTFTNRIITVDNDTATNAYCWESCDPCSSTGLVDIVNENELNVLIVDQNQLSISGLTSINPQVQVFNTLGQPVPFDVQSQNHQSVLTLKNTIPGILIIRVFDGELVRTAKLFVY